MPAKKLWTGPCFAGDCDRPVTSKGYCDRHYRHVKKYGEARPAFLSEDGKRPGRPPMERLCKTCGESDPANFYPHMGGMCKKCNTRKGNEWARKNPERYTALALKSRLKGKYGMTPDEYDAMVLAQGNRCSSCGGPPVMTGGGVVKLMIDHDHVAGHVRGLLCNRCNFAAGYLLNDPKLALALADYLVRTEAVPTHGQRTVYRKQNRGDAPVPEGL